MPQAVVHAGDRRYRLTFPAGDPIGLDIVDNGGRPYEWELLRWLERLLEGREGAFVDVGANIGNHAAYFASTGRRVVAIEPHPEALRYLRENVAPFDVDVYPVAAGVRSGAGRVIGSPDGTLGRNQFDASAGGDVEVRSVNSIRRDFGEPGEPGEFAAIKIDVEGGEEDVLRGAEIAIAVDLPLVVVEAWDRAHRRRVSYILGVLGYHRVPVSLCSTPTYLWAPSWGEWARAMFSVDVARHLGRGAAGRARGAVKRVARIF